MEWVSQVKTKTHPWWPPGNLSREVFESSGQETGCLSTPRGLHLSENETWTWCLFLRAPIAEVWISVFLQIWNPGLWPQHGLGSDTENKEEGSRTRQAPKNAPIPLPSRTDVREQWKRSQSSMPWQDPHIPSLHLQHSQVLSEPGHLETLEKIPIIPVPRDVNHQKSTGRQGPLPFSQFNLHFRSAHHQLCLPPQQAVPPPLPLESTFSKSPLLSFSEVSFTSGSDAQSFPLQPLKLWLFSPSIRLG